MMWWWLLWWSLQRSRRVSFCLDPHVKMWFAGWAPDMWKVASVDKITSGRDVHCYIVHKTAVSCESGYWKFEKWKWKINLFHFFREVKSEINIWFTLFEKWKVKDKSLSLFPRSEKWTENLVHSFREWKVKWKCLEIEIEKWNFSRILEKFFRIKKILRFDPNAFHFAIFFSGMLKRVKLVRKVEYQMYELLLVAVQYWA